MSIANPASSGLSDITEPSAVLAAIGEFDRIGRQAFLQTYGYESSRDYFLEVDGKLYDSKPILSWAYGAQHPDRGPLPVAAFSGGVDAAVRHLKRLGFNTTTRAEWNPPRLGIEYQSRTEIQQAYGGDKIAGIIRFPGESFVNVFSDADGPYDDDEPTLTEPFGYRGEGSRGDQSLTQRGNKLLEEARLKNQATRFWYRPSGGTLSFIAWTAVLGRAWVLGMGTDGRPRKEIEWHLQAVPAMEPETWPAEARHTIADASEDLGGKGEAEASPSATYEQLLKRIEQLGQAKRANGVVRTNYPRSAAARRAVLLRSAGKCESPYCTGMPGEPNRAGLPILDVDHIKDLGLGGADHPANMIALCPNCHAVKTRGKDRAKRRKALLAIAAASHLSALEP